MKETGVSWLGEIPAHWEFKPLKRVAEIQSGLTLGKTYTGNVKDYPYLRVANVQDGYFDLNDIATVSIPEEMAEAYYLRRGDVLVTEGGDPDKLGRGFVWMGQIENCLHQNHVFAVRPSAKVLNPYYLALLSQSAYGRNYFMYTAKQTTNLASTNSTTLKQFALPLPPIGEQATIVSHLEEQSRRINEAIARIEREIELINEYRTALISEVVTGKVDVRDRK